MNQDYLKIETLLNQLIMDNRQLNQYNQEEQRYNSANDQKAIEELRSAKDRLDGNLKQTLNQLESILSNVVSYGDLLVKLSFYAGTLEIRNQSNLLNLIQSLREEYKFGVQLLQLSRRMAGANSNHHEEFVQSTGV